MKVEECIITRRSIRKYKDKAVDWEKVVQIVNAGKLAPSAGNLQNWKFVVVRNKLVREKLSEASFDQDWMVDAGVHIVVVAEPSKAGRFYGARGERLYTIQNCAAAVQNMLLMAHDIGLGSCWVGAFDEAKVKKVLGMTEDVSPQAIVVIGYTDEKLDMPPRRELEHTIYLDKWKGQGKGFKAKGYTGVVVKETMDNTKKALKKVAKKLKKK